MSRWGGRKVAKLVELTLATRGRECWLCELDGADSADHEPPRSELVAAGVPDPDALVYLYPAHLICNQRRLARPVTPELQADLRRRRLADIAELAASADLSPVLAARRPVLLTRHADPA